MIRLYQTQLAFCFACFVTLAAYIAGAQDIATPNGDSEWIEMFNGEDLEGWTPKIKGYPVGVNFGDTFRVEDGVLKVSYDQYEGRFAGRFGHLFYDVPMSRYVMQLEYRFVGEQYPTGSPGWAIRNSGVMIHGQTAASMPLKQDFPVSIEVQLLGGDGQNDRTTGNLCTPGTNVVLDGRLHTDHCKTSTSQTYHGEQWVTCEIEVHGNELIRHKINDEIVFEYTQPQLDQRDATAKRLLDLGADRMLDRGTISLQSESHPVEFRNIRIRRLAE